MLAVSGARRCQAAMARLVKSVTISRLTATNSRERCRSRKARSKSRRARSAARVFRSKYPWNSAEMRSCWFSKVRFPEIRSNLRAVARARIKRRNLRLKEPVEEKAQETAAERFADVRRPVNWQFEFPPFSLQVK